MDGFEVKDMKYPEDNKISEYDMIMLTGSAASAFEDIPWISHLVTWIQRIAGEYPGVKIYGICFGHQIVGRALGGVCVRNDIGWEFGPTKVQLSGIGKSLFGTDEISIQQMHRDHVPLESLSDAFSSGKIHLIGSTDVSDNQGFVKYQSSSPDSNSQSPEQIHIITLQGHPEFTESIVTGIVRLRSGDIGADNVKGYFGAKGDSDGEEPSDKEGTGRRWWKNDGVDVIGKVFWKILGVGLG